VSSEVYLGAVKKDASANELETALIVYFYSYGFHVTANGSCYRY
jgi:hypothetical protein